MTEEGTVEQVTEHVKSLVERKRKPASIRGNLVTIGRLLHAEGVQAHDMGGPKALQGVPLVVDESVPESEVQVLDDEDKVIRTLKIPAR
jgi:hypothetical protein